MANKKKLRQILYGLLLSITFSSQNINSVIAGLLAWLRWWCQIHTKWRWQTVEAVSKINIILIHSGTSTVTAGSDHCFRTCCPYVCPAVHIPPLFKIKLNKRNFMWKQCSLLARLWVCLSGSWHMMTHVLYFYVSTNLCNCISNAYRLKFI